MSALRDGARLGIVLTFEACAVALLWWLGSVPGLDVPLADPDGLRIWLAVTPADQALVAALRLVGLVAACWLLASTLLYTLARASRIPAALRAVEWTTLPSVRRVVDRAVAFTFATSIAVGPTGALAATAPPPPLREPVAAQPAEPHVPAPQAAPAERPPEALLPPALGPPPSAAEDVPERDSARPKPAAPEPAPEVTPEEPPAIHVVAPGESLWRVAAARIGSEDPRRVGPYWRRLVAVNRDLPSGDPDLIHPGLRLRLPPIDEPDPGGPHG